MSIPIIQARNLCKTYDNEGVQTQAVCGVTFDVKKGEYIAIMGPSGSGKSTLMQMLGFLDRPSEGDYFFDGKDTFKFTDDQLARIRNNKVGFVFQAFNLLPRTTVFENIELPLLYDEKLDKGDSKEKKVINALKSVSMEHRVTNIYRREAGGWKIVHHHTDVSPVMLDLLSRLQVET